MSSRTTTRTAAIIVFTSILACGEPEPEPLPPLTSVLAPFPNDLFTTDQVNSSTGLRLNLQPTSTPLTEQALKFGLWQPGKLQGWLNGLDGFSTYGPIYFTVDRELDPSSLPANEEASTGKDASLFLVNLQAGSTRRGQRIPVSARYSKVKDEKLGTIHLVDLRPGVPLEPAALHGVVALRVVRGKQGSGGIGASGHFQVLSGQRELTPDAAQLTSMSRARKRAKPLFDYLAESKITTAQVAEAFVFTTQSATSLLTAIRAYLRGPKAPPLNLKWLGSYTPDKLPGRPANLEDLSSVGVIVKGQFDAPDFRGADGDVASPPAYTKLLTVPFIIALPAKQAKDPARVVMLQHGHGGKKEFALYVAPHLAKHGIATAAIDHVGHGELSGTGTFIEIVNIQKLRGNFVQTTATGLRLIQVLRSITKVLADGKTHELATSRALGYIGESLGGISGASLVGVEPDVGVVVLNVTGGGLSSSLVGSYLSIIGDDKLLLKLGIMASFQAMVDRMDPANFAPLYTGAGKQVLMQNVTSDSLGTETVYTLARAMGASYVCPCPQDVPLPALPRKTLPTTGPGLYYYSVGKHGFLLSNYTNPSASRAVRGQAAHFFKTYFNSGKAMIIEPPAK